MSTRQHLHQQRLIAEGRCRYGREHETPPPGSPMCAACRRRDTDRERVAYAKNRPERRRYTCRACGGEGHNTRTCQASPAI